MKKDKKNKVVKFVKENWKPIAVSGILVTCAGMALVYCKRTESDPTEVIKNIAGDWRKEFTKVDSDIKIDQTMTLGDLGTLGEEYLKVFPDKYTTETPVIGVDLYLGKVEN